MKSSSLRQKLGTWFRWWAAVFDRWRAVTYAFAGLLYVIGAIRGLRITWADAVLWTILLAQAVLAALVPSTPPMSKGAPKHSA